MDLNGDRRGEMWRVEQRIGLESGQLFGVCYCFSFWGEGVGLGRVCYMEIMLGVIGIL